LLTALTKIQWAFLVARRERQLIFDSNLFVYHYIGLNLVNMIATNFRRIIKVISFFNN